MRKTLIFLVLINISFILSGQNHPDLGLHGVVTWIDSTHIKVEYDWSDDSQLSDWVMTSGSTLVRGNGSVTITGGYVFVRSMMWKQGIKCSRITAKDAAPLSAEGHHLNFYSNLVSFTGRDYLPDPGLGAVLATYKNFWTHDGTDAGSIGAPYLVVGVARDYEYNVSAAGMTIKSSVDNVVYSDNTPCVPALERKIALGGWGGDTKWGKITIEGEITMPWQDEPVPSDVINIESYGAVFAPVIEVVGNPAIEWVFDDSATSTSATPVKDYGSTGSRHNYLKVTPWSALIGINVGYAGDGGYGGFDMVDNQNVLGFRNLKLAKSSLQYLCASYNPITELDLRELTALKYVELFHCQFLDTLMLGSHPVLKRLCVEDNNLISLDLSGCTALGDLRGALNNYTSINWGSVGQSLWHICIRDNPQIKVNIPALTQFPLLRELLTWNTNQTGAFVCHSSVIESIESYKNHYTSADISGCTSLVKFTLSGSQLSSLDLGTANSLINVQLKECGLTESQVDYVLITLDGAGQFNGDLDLSGNTAPSADGLIYLNNLKARGWTIQTGFLTGIADTKETAGSLKTIVTSDEIKILLTDDFISWKAGLYSFRGEKVLSKIIDSNTLVFNVSSLPAGIYIVVLSDGEQRRSVKIFKP